MPKTLWLLRHAKTVADPPQGGTDFDRVLAPRGRRDATALAERFGPKGTLPGLSRVPRPSLALVSPAARTEATADLVLAHMKKPPAVQLVHDLYGAEPEDVLDLLRALPQEMTSVMVVGHNPTAHALAMGLIAKSDKKGHDLAVRRSFPTCALGVYRFEGDHWSDVGAHTAKLAGLLVPPFDEG